MTQEKFFLKLPPHLRYLGNVFIDSRLVGNHHRAFTYHFFQGAFDNLKDGWMLFCTDDMDPKITELWFRHFCYLYELVLDDIVDEDPIIWNGESVENPRRNKILLHFSANCQSPAAKAVKEKVRI